MEQSPNISKGSSIKVTLSGASVPSLQVDNVVIPQTLVGQVSPWMPLLFQLQRIVGDRVLVTSVKTSFNGQLRDGSSHPNGWAIDVTFPDRITPGTNPHFENDIYLMTYMSSILSGPVIFAFESDHIHIEVSKRLQGVFRYPTSRPAHYTNDRLASPRTAKDEQLWKVEPTSIYLDPKAAASLSIQRNDSLRILDPAILTKLVNNQIRIGKSNSLLGSPRTK